MQLAQDLGEKEYKIDVYKNGKFVMSLNVEGGYFKETIVTVLLKNGYGCWVYGGFK